jgi:hypothetical protein
LVVFFEDCCWLVLVQQCAIIRISWLQLSEEMREQREILDEQETL